MKDCNLCVNKIEFTDLFKYAKTSDWFAVLAKFTSRLTEREFLNFLSF